MIAVSPDTVVRFHRALWHRYWTWRSRTRKPGVLSAAVREAVIRAA